MVLGVWKDKYNGETKQNSEWDPHAYSQLILNKASKGIHRGRESLQQMVLDHVKKKEKLKPLCHIIHKM